MTGAGGRPAPRVTVLMPVYNRERFVDEAIQSVLGQDYDDLELLLVDDGSSDGTPALLRAWAGRDARTVVVTSASNLGIPGALNLGLAHARGQYIARLDSDDLMMPQRLRAQVEVLDRQAEVVLVSSAHEFMDADGGYLGTSPGDEPHEVVVFLLNFFNIVGGGGQVMFRRSEVLEEGGFSLEYPASEDYDMWVRLLRRGRILSLPLIGMKQRHHDARSLVQFGAYKRANWTGIMGHSLTRYLGRPIAGEEIDALISIWRHDGRQGAAAMADRMMREAYVRFCGEHADPALRQCASARIALQWRHGAHHFEQAGHPAEAREYAGRAATWAGHD